MEELKLVQSFLGDTKVYPSGLKNQNKSSFLTRQLKKVLAIGSLAAATLSPTLVQAQTQEETSSPSITQTIRTNISQRTFQEMNKTEQKAIQFGIDLAMRTLKLVHPELTQKQLNEMHENAFKVSFTEEQITLAKQQYQSFQKLSSSERETRLEQSVTQAATAMKKYMPR